MKTLEQIKLDILAQNPSKIYIINEIEFEQTEKEFQYAIDKRAEMEFEQQTIVKEISDSRQALLDRLGITSEEAQLLLGGNN